MRTKVCFQDAQIQLQYISGLIFIVSIKCGTFCQNGILLMENLDMDKIEVFLESELYRNYHAVVENRDRNRLSREKTSTALAWIFLLS